jgi:serine/threonine protein kinase
MSIDKNKRDTQIVGSYILGQTIGEGAFAKVKLATHQITNEKVAIKILDKESLQEDEDDFIRVKREIAILKKLRHRNITQLFELMESERKIYLIMEYCEGKELYDYIILKEKLREEEACRIFQEMIDGIEYLHSQNIVHRDLKPENLLFDSNLTVKITDLGLSTTYTNDKLLSTRCGTPSYAPPEMLRGEEYHGLLSDIWSCGIILYAMLVGYLPFSESDEDINRDKIIDGEYEIPDNLSDEVIDLLHNILQTDPMIRYTIEDIKAHPWFNLLPPKHNPGLIIDYHNIPVDENILEYIQKEYNLNKEEIRENIMNNKFNSNTATYYLTVKKTIRDGKKSISDLQSESFLEYINNEYISLINLPRPTIVKKEENKENPKDAYHDYAGANINERLSFRKSLIIHEDIAIEVQTEVEKNKYELAKRMSEKNDKIRKLIKIENNKEFIVSISHTDRRSLLIRNSSNNEISFNEHLEEIKINDYSNEELLNDNSHSCNYKTNHSFIAENNIDIGRGNEEIIGPIITVGEIGKNDKKKNIQKKIKIKSIGVKTKFPNILQQKNEIKSNNIAIHKRDKKYTKSQDDSKNYKYEISKYSNLSKRVGSIQKITKLNQESLARKKVKVKSQKDLNYLRISSSVKSLSYNYSNFQNDSQELKYLRVARRIPKSVCSPIKSSQNKNRDMKGRLLSVDKQIKIKRYDTSIEKSISNSPTRNISYSPNKTNQIQKNTVKIIPWNIKRKCLEEDNKQFQDYELFKNKINTERDNKLKKVNIKPINIKDEKQLNTDKSITKVIPNNQFETFYKKINFNNLSQHTIDKMVVYDGFIDLSTIIVCDIHELYYRLINMILSNKLFYIQVNPLKFKCSKYGYNFDIEIHKLEIVNTYFMKFKSKAGDIIGYRRMIQNLFNDMKIV